MSVFLSFHNFPNFGSEDNTDFLRDYSLWVLYTNDWA